MYPLSEKKALALAGGRFLSNSFYLEHLADVRFSGYPYNSTYPGNITSATGGKLLDESTKMRGGESLGITTINVSTITPKAVQVANKLRKYDYLRYVKDNIQGMGFRTSGCMKALKDEVQVVRHGEHYHYHGLMLCGSVWLCPVCASRISEVRKQELTQAVERSGYYPVLVSVTLQHQRGDGLADKVKVLNTSLRKLKGGRWWGAFVARYGIKAYASSLEVTYSEEHGWHPHKHILFFLESADVDIKAFQDELTSRYALLVDKEGGYASIYHSIDVQAGAYSAGAYVSKWGAVAELTKANLKSGRQGSYSMWELAELGMREGWARKAFQEYASATYGKKAITWSHGAREVLGLGAEISDEDIAQTEEEAEEVITTIPREAWKLVLLTGNEGMILMLAEAGGKQAVDRYVAELVDMFSG